MKTSKSTQLAAFDKVLGMCETFGPDYQPSNGAIDLTALATLLKKGRLSQKAVNDAFDAYTLAANRRAKAFEEIPKFATRIGNMLVLSDVATEIIDEVNVLKKKLTYRKPQRSSAKVESEQTVKGNPSVQLSYAAIEENFRRIVEVASAVEAYNPNETDLKKSALEASYRQLSALSGEVLERETALMKARRVGKEVMTELHETVKLVKRYVRTAFGIKSAEYAPFKAIVTTKPV